MYNENWTAFLAEGDPTFFHDGGIDADALNMRGVDAPDTTMVLVESNRWNRSSRRNVLIVVTIKRFGRNSEKQVNNQ